MPTRTMRMMSWTKSRREDIAKILAPPVVAPPRVRPKNPARGRVSRGGKYGEPGIGARWVLSASVPKHRAIRAPLFAPAGFRTDRCTKYSTAPEVASANFTKHLFQDAVKIYVVEDLFADKAVLCHFATRKPNGDFTLRLIC